MYIYIYIYIYIYSFQLREYSIYPLLLFAGETPCTVLKSSTEELDCTAGESHGGSFPVMLYVEGKGNASSSAAFTYELSIIDVNPAQGK